MTVTLFNGFVMETVGEIVSGVGVGVAQLTTADWMGLVTVV